MKQPFYICRHCGNIIARIRNKGVPIFCCGAKMYKITPSTAEASKEKHAQLRAIGCEVYSVSTDPHFVHSYVDQAYPANRKLAAETPKPSLDLVGRL